MTETSSQTKQKQNEASTGPVVCITPKAMTESVFLMSRDASRSHRQRRERTSHRHPSASKTIKKHHRASGLVCSLKYYVMDKLSVVTTANASAAPGSIEWALASWKKGA